MNRRIEAIFRNKELFHEKMARMPFSQKTAIIENMQKIVSKIKASRQGLKMRVKI